MTTYRPLDRKELVNLLKNAADSHTEICTGKQRTSGIGLDFQYFVKILDLDTQNLTVTAERNVTLGTLEDTVNAKGLHLSFYTSDLRAVRLGDFFAEQMLSLTNIHDKQPRFQVLGLEVILVDGTIVNVGGKTIKNVTGYDMNRLFISSGESLAIPLSFIIKLSSLEETEVMLEAVIDSERVLRPLVMGLRQTNRKPKACVYWNGIIGKWYGLGKTGGLLMVLSGSRERVQRDLELVENLFQELGISWNRIQDKQSKWKMISAFRKDTAWQNGLKVPSLSCGEVLQELEERSIGVWYSIMEGNMQLMPGDGIGDKIVYRSLCRKAELLGGAGNARLMQKYQLLPGTERKMWMKLKQEYDPNGRLNVEAGGENSGTRE